ncbi:MAG TPA: chemotaxis protein CheB [Verrucomicrobiae bacterium]|nr:chemotaxis protein CheB [Verrucomicrobiae bacterium]
MRSARKNSEDTNRPEAAASETTSAQNSFPIVGIGASAGGLEAFTELLKHLPEKTGMAFVLVQHLDPSHQSHLTGLLARATTIPVRQVTDGMTIEPDHIFVIPPNANMGIAGGKLKLTPRDEKGVPHLPVDFLFRSLAHEQQSWAIGVILSGTGSDGAAGLAEIKGVGGITFAQDEKSARFSGMPSEAANAHVDFILPPDKIAQELGRIGRDPYLVLPAKAESEEKQADARDFRRVLALLRSHTGVDFSQYRDTTIKRRIQRRMVVHARHTLADYIQFLEKNSGEAKLLFEDVLINVTSFFREPEMFEALKTEVFPQILKSAPSTIRIWVPACSTGQEAYSMAIALLEFLESKPNPPGIQIFATDVNEAVSIEKARRGLFSESIESEISPERLRRHFTKGDGGYRINQTIRDLCIFARQNITSDPPFSRMDLVSCRNLLIYFTPELQRRVVSMFHYALNLTGFLVLGSSETVGENSDMFAVLDRKFKIYSKKGTTIRPFSHFTAEDLKPGTLVMPGKAAYSPGPSDFQKEADRILLGRYAPAAVLVNSNLEILQFRGRTSPYLEPPAGPASFNLLKMARGNLPLELGTAIKEALRQNKPIERPMRFHDGNETRQIVLELVPVKLPGSGENCVLVLFEATEKEIPATQKVLQEQKKEETGDTNNPAAQKDVELEQLRRDLVAAREYLQAITEQHDAANEELKCANEEVLSSNEELQSTNEQLGTAKEELQSTNEELVTLNEELQTRNAELNQLNSELKAAHEKLLDYVSAIADTVRAPFLVLYPDFRVHKANDAFCRMFQVSTDETENRLVFELGDRQWDIPELHTAFSQILSGKSTLRNYEVAHDFQKIGRRVMLLNAQRLEQKRGGPMMILLSIEDVTEFKQMETSNQWLAAIVESSNDAIISRDLDGRIVSCNLGASQLYGYAPEELIGKPMTILLLPESLDDEMKVLGRIRRGEKIEHYETVRRRKDGTRVDVLVTISPVRDAQGKIIGASNASRDITQRKRAERELAESLAREKAARESAEAAGRAKDDFLAALSHELRTPLHPVLMVASDRASNFELPSDVRADFEAIAKNIEMEARLIDDLLDITRITRGKLSLDLRRVDAHMVLLDVIEKARPQIDEKRLKVVFGLKAKQHTVCADTVRLQQVFWNVLRNAIKFTPDGGIITVETSSPERGGPLTVKITDTGLGMTTEELERAFLAFSQGDHAKHEPHRFGGGLGLGLAISKRLVELHSGSIRAMSDGRDHGSAIVIELPLELPAAGASLDR